MPISATEYSVKHDGHLSEPAEVPCTRIGDALRALEVLTGLAAAARPVRLKGLLAHGVGALLR